MFVEDNMGIYSKLKEQSHFNYKKGELELQHLYKEINLTMAEQQKLAKDTTIMIIDVYKNNGSYEDITLNEGILIDFGVALVMKLNAIVKSGILPITWIKTLTEDLIYKSNSPSQVKLGLLLSEKYLSANKLKDVVETFSKDGEFIFYLFRSIRNLNKYGEYLFNLYKTSKGTIKFFALTNIDFYKDKQIDYFLDKGYEDEYYEKYIIEYLLTVCDLSTYLQRIKTNVKQLNKLSKLIYKHLRYNSLRESVIKEFILKEFMEVVKEIGTDFYSLMVMLLICQEMATEEPQKENKEKYMPMALYLKKEKWKKIFLKEIKGKRATTLDIIEMANFYDYTLSLEELTTLYERNKLDFYLYWYVNNKASEDIKKVFLSYYLEAVELKELLDNNGEQRGYNKKVESNDKKILLEVLKGCKKIFPEGKNLALMAIQSKSLEIRIEAAKYLLMHKEKLSEKELELIEKIEAVEADYQLKVMLNGIQSKENKYKIEFINKLELKNFKITRHVKDIYLMSTYVSGFRYREQELLLEELKNSRMFFLKIEENNIYDTKAVKIIGESGYVIGYIPKKDTEILSNLLVKNLYVYCVVREYSFEENHISLDVFMSYKNVLDEASELWKVLMSKNNGNYKN